MGEGEDAELQCQIKVVYEAVKSKNSHARLQIFEAEGRAGARCQVNDLRLARSIVFDWLDTLLEQERV